MNEFDAFVKKTVGGYVVMLRKAEDAEAKPVLKEGGSKEFFDDELAATQAALQSVLCYFNGPMFRFGERAGETAAAVNSQFRVEKKPARSRTITVVYKRGKANAKAR